jgi:hypothetical protein
MDTKVCKTCGVEKELSFFPRTKRDDGSYWYSLECKECKKVYQKEWHNKNKDKVKINQKQYRLDNKDTIKENKKQYAAENAEIIANYQKKYRIDNAETIKNNNKQYYLDNKESLNEYNKQWRLENKIENDDQAREYQKQYVKNKRANDPSFKLRTNISVIIKDALLANGSSKKGKSIIDYLPYTFQDLKYHLECQFEMWMSWSNYGKYNAKTWQEDNPLTWKWNIDHIIPQASLPYTSMEDDNFKKCWALENLRPYSAKLNLIDGVKRVRHRKDSK